MDFRDIITIAAQGSEAAVPAGGPFGTDDGFDDAGAWTIIEVNNNGGSLTVAASKLNYTSRTEYRAEQDTGSALPVSVDVSFDWAVTSVGGNVTFKVYLGGTIHDAVIAAAGSSSGTYSDTLAAGSSDNKRGVQITCPSLSRTATVDNFVTSG